VRTTIVRPYKRGGKGNGPRAVNLDYLLLSLCHAHVGVYAGVARVCGVGAMHPRSIMPGIDPCHKEHS